MATPGLFELVQRLSPPSPKSTLQFAKLMGEGETLSRHPDLVNLMVASGHDSTISRTNVNEARAIISPFALLAPSAFRRRLRVRADDLRRLGVPTLLVWGEREPLGDVAVASAVVDLIPEATLSVVPGGHAPWLGQPDRTANVISTFLQRGTYAQTSAERCGNAPAAGRAAEPVRGLRGERQ
jgi:pimeloyl-ACP methyl ester carboxylesterase